VPKKQDLKNSFLEKSRAKKTGFKKSRAQKQQNILYIFKG